MNINNHTTYDATLLTDYNNAFLLRYLLTRFSFFLVVVILASVYLWYIQMTSYILILYGILALNIVILLIMNYVGLKKTINQLGTEFEVDFEFHAQDFYMTQSIAPDTKQVNYEDLTKIKLTKKFMLIYIKTSQQPLVLRRSGFENEEDAETVIKRVEPFLPKKK